MSQSIPNRIVTCNDKDAPWITPEVISAIKRNSRVYRQWVLKGRIPNDKDNVGSVQNEKAKKDYINNLSSKLNDL